MSRKKFNKHRRERLNESYYKPELYYFNYRTKDNRLLFEFETFIKQSLTPLTGEIQRQGNMITVTDLDLRSVVNAGGKDREVLIWLTNSFHMNSKQRNPSYKDKHEMDILSTIVSQSTTFRKMMNELKKYMENIEKEQGRWNIVAYRDFLAGVRS